MGRGSQTEGPRAKLLFVKIKNAKQNEKVHFELTSKASKEAEEVAEGTERSLSGKLVFADHRKWDLNGEPKDDIILTLQDEKAGELGERYRIQITLGSIGRNVINSLLSAENFDDVLTIRLYNNKKGYASVWVGLGFDGVGQAVALPWKISPDDAAKFITKEKKKAKDANGKIIEKVQNNYIEYDAQLLELFKNNIIPKMKYQPKEAVSETTGTASAGATDDLPF